MAAKTMMKSYNPREFTRLLMNNGFEKVRHNGDHRIWKRNHEMIVTDRNMNEMVIRRLIKEHNLQI